MDPASSADSEVHDRHRARHAAMTEETRFAPWIDGAPYETNTTTMIMDPVIGEPIVEVPLCSPEDVDTAVDAAWEAFDAEWSSTTPSERSRYMHEWIDELEDHREELAMLESLDCGKPIAQARGEIDGALDTLGYFASVCRAQRGAEIPAARDVHVYTTNEPFGVVGQIVPWNYPLWAAAWKLGPALAAGNACVLKPASDTPLTTIRAAQLSADVFPDGVINVIPGTGGEVGTALTSHDRVRKVSFTGSTSVGRGVMRAAAKRVAPVTLELGGKSPFIVFPDADLERVIEAVASGIFYSTGEICDAFSRVLVHESIASEFTDRFVERARAYVLGDPLLAETTMGPLTSRDQFEQVMSYIDTGRAEAKLLCGGEPPDDESLADGWYVQPTVFGEVTNEMTIAQEEIFGPVQTILTFESYDEAIELANDTRYGLAAGIGTERTSLVHQTAADLEAGLIYVNEYGPILPEAPYGGVKESGFGKDLGLEAVSHYQATKTVYVNLDEPDLGEGL